MPLRPERVVEVRYDHLEGRRFRHTAQFVRWRLDRDPHSCTYDQLEEAVSFNLAEITLSPHHTAAWGLLKEDAGLALRFARFTGR